jgi:hypothetical protein
VWVILRDGTSGRTTYGASRQLVVPAPGPPHRGRAVFCAGATGQMANSV